MKTLRAFLWRIKGLLQGGRRKELSDEIESNLQLHVDDNLRAGMPQDQARRQAVLKLGGVQPTMEAYRDRNTVPFLEHLWQDTRFAARQLQKNRGFAVTAVFILALGLCGSLAIFAFVDAALIKPLPYRASQELVGVYESIPLCPECNLSYLDFLDWKRMNSSFSSFSAYQGTRLIQTTKAGARTVRAARVSDDFFRTLGVIPALGRDFHSGEDSPGAPRTVLLSDRKWREEFHGNSSALGRGIVLEGELNTVIGGLPPDFHFAAVGTPDFWTALHPGGSCEDRRGCHNLYGVARLKPGVAFASALADVKRIAGRLQKQYPDSNRGQGAVLVSLGEVLVGKIRPILLVLLSGAALLLLIATVNVSSLLLVRSESRRREFAMRSALGAGRSRLLCQFVTEGVLLVLLAMGAGLLGSLFAMQILRSLLSVDMLTYMPFLANVGLNRRVMLFAAVVSCGSIVLFTLAPALGRRTEHIGGNLSEGSRGSAGNTRRRIGTKLVVIELATAVVLLVGAGLLTKSLHRLLHVDIGFAADHLAHSTVSAPITTYKTLPQQVALARRVITELSVLPGVQSAALTSVSPVNFNGNTTWIRIAGKPYGGEHNETNERDVSADYFRTLRVKLLAGRFFSDAEDSTKPQVMIINKALARKYFPGEDPIGKQIGDISLSPQSLRQVVGVIDDLREGALDAEIWPAVYHPLNQDPGTGFYVLLRTSQSEHALLPQISSTLGRIDPGITTSDSSSMEDKINNSTAAYLRRTSAWLVGAFACVALMLSGIGMYGVISYSVTQRTREVGVRMALGAQRGDVYRLILREAGWLTLLGIAIGLAVSLFATTFMQSLLFAVQSWDVPTLATVTFVLVLIALLASFLPARRAASVNLVNALRAE